MIVCYFVRHQYHKGERTESKAIGVFSSQQTALGAIEQLKDQPGFKDWPDSFIITPVDLDQIAWGEIENWDSPPE